MNIKDLVKDWSNVVQAEFIDNKIEIELPAGGGDYTSNFPRTKFIYLFENDGKIVINRYTYFEDKPQLDLVFGNQEITDTHFKEKLNLIFKLSRRRDNLEKLWI